MRDGMSRRVAVQRWWLPRRVRVSGRDQESCVSQYLLTCDALFDLPQARTQDPGLLCSIDNHRGPLFRRPFCLLTGARCR